MKLAGQIALVTGGSRGIGRATALAFAAEGADIAFCHLDDGAKARGDRERDPRAGPARDAPVARRRRHRRQPRVRAARSTTAFGPIDILFNNAGMNIRKRFEDYTEADYDRILDVHMKGMFFMAQAVYPAMVARGRGCIINVASQRGLKGAVNSAPYCAAKAAIIGFTRALACEAAPKGVRVNAIAPGPIVTDLTATMAPADRAGVHRRTAGAPIRPTRGDRRDRAAAGRAGRRLLCRRDPVAERRGRDALRHRHPRDNYERILRIFKLPALSSGGRLRLSGRAMRPRQESHVSRMPGCASEQRAGRRAARPVVLSAWSARLAIGQAWCAALLLAERWPAHAADWPAILRLAFAVLALLRAALSVDRRPHGVRRRCGGTAAAAHRRAVAPARRPGRRSCATQHTGELTATVVDRIEALDGLHSRWLPAVGAGCRRSAAGGAGRAGGRSAGRARAGAVRAAGAGRDGGCRRSARRPRRAASSWRWRGCRRASSTACVASPPSCCTARRRPRRARSPRPRTNCGAAPCACCASPSCPRPRSIWRRRSPSSSWRCTTARRLLAGGLLQPGMRAVRAAAGPRVLRPAARLCRGLSGPAARRRRGRGAGGSAAAAAHRSRSARCGPWRRTASPWRSRTCISPGIPARGPALNGLSFRVPDGETLVLAGSLGRRQIDRDRDPAGFRASRPGTRDDQRRRHRRPRAAGAGAAHRLDRPAPGAVLGQHPRQHPLRPPRSHRGRRSTRRRAAARVGEFAAALPDGLDTSVGEGGYGLSGGQAQRVAIARAFLKNAPLLLLDEPTAHLDPATEPQVLDSLRRLALGRTVILASHSSAAHGFAGRRLDIRDGRAVPARGAA